MHPADAEITFAADPDSELPLRQRVRTLDGILRVGAGVLAAILLVSLVTERSWVPVLVYGPGIALHLAHLWWLRRGVFRTVAISHCLTYFAWVTTILVFRVGGLGPQAAMVYPPLVLMAGLVWSRRAAVGMALLVSAAGFLLAALEKSGVLPAPQRSSPWQLWLVMSGCVVVTAALIRFALGIIVRAAEERRMLEERLRDAQRVDALGRLAGGVAHDFNNLLTVILASADLLEPELPEGSQEVQSIRDAATRAAGLTRQLLAFGRRQVLVAESVELGQAMQDARPLLERLLHEEVRLELRPASAEACCIVVDRSQLQLVLMNLVLNARDAMPRGGVISLEWGDGRPPAKSIPELEVPSAWIAVRDTGSGIVPEIRSRIFEPFFTTKEPGRGTGLGLATVHGIVRQSGGTIWFETELGAGTTFYVLLPRSEQSPRPAHKPQEPAHARPGASVLVVEDEPALRSAVKAILEKGGYSVAEAGSGEEAMHLLERSRPPFDLMLPDAVMFATTDAEPAREARARQPGLRVLFTPGHSDEMVAARGVRSSEAEFVPKPFTAEDLLPRVAEALSPRAHRPREGQPPGRGGALGANVTLVPRAPAHPGRAGAPTPGSVDP